MPHSSAQAKHPASPNPRRLPSRLMLLLRRHTTLIVVLCALALCAATLGVHAAKYPNFASFWVGVDQQRYLEAARAWAQGDFSPARHHYLPLYPLLGAAFIWLTPWQPFMLPDLACLLAAMAIFIRIGRRLSTSMPASGLAICFVAGVLSGRTDAAIWTVPWSTTGSAPFQFAAVLAALRFGERPTAGRAGLIGLAIALTAGFRPSDAAVLAAACGLFAAWVLLRDRTAIGRAAILAAGGVLGLCIGLAPSVVAHIAIFGLSPGPYVSQSAGIGFEWRLLPMRWVMLVIGTRPMLPEGAGLAFGLPWVATGIAGMLLGLASAARRSPAMFLAAGVLSLHWALYLAYRDLQPYGLWRFYNIHYFKWTFPFLALWTAQLLAALSARHSRGPALAVGLATLLLLAWRPVLRTPASFAPAQTGHALPLPADASLLLHATFLPLTGSWNDLYFSRTTWTLAGHDFRNTEDFKLLPVPGGAILLPLRLLPHVAGALQLPADIQAISGGSATVFRQAIVFGLPCTLFGRFRPACR